MDLEKKEEEKERGEMWNSENGSFRNTTHLGKCHNAFHGVKTVLA